MSMIILLNIVRECFDTFTNLLEKKASSLEEGRIQSKVVCIKEVNLSLTTGMKKWRNPFSQKKILPFKEEKFAVNKEGLQQSPQGCKDQEGSHTKQ